MVGQELDGVGMKALRLGRISSQAQPRAQAGQGCRLPVDTLLVLICLGKRAERFEVVKSLLIGAPSADQLTQTVDMKHCVEGFCRR